MPDRVLWVVLTSGRHVHYDVIGLVLNLTPAHITQPNRIHLILYYVVLYNYLYDILKFQDHIPYTGFEKCCIRICYCGMCVYTSERDTGWETESKSTSQSPLQCHKGHPRSICHSSPVWISEPVRSVINWLMHMWHVEVKWSGLLRSCLVWIWFYTCVTMCPDQLLLVGWMLITRCCYFIASSRLGMTAKPAEDLSSAGSVPLRAALHRPLGRSGLSSWLAFLLALLVVTCASRAVIESLSQLFSCYLPCCLTSHPHGYIKICSLKRKWNTLLPQIILLCTDSVFRASDGASYLNI